MTYKVSIELSFYSLLFQGQVINKQNTDILFWSCVVFLYNYTFKMIMDVQLSACREL